jgi:DUF1365 family protein
MAAIHWEALWPWIKGARLVPRPKAPVINAGLASGQNRDYTQPVMSAHGSNSAAHKGALVRLE